MNIVIFGAGAIGSLFGALLAKNNSVVLVGRGLHVTRIRQNGLIIKGKTRLSVMVPAGESIEDVNFPPDIILLCVKSYDTETASKDILPIIHKQTIVISLQNGLDNITTMMRNVKKNHIIAGVTTHGAFFSKPGEIIHTGKGKTIVGELDGSQSKRLESLVTLFHKAGIETKMSGSIQKEIWKKAIVNSSINPLTAFLECKNGYLLKNPLMEKLVEYVCRESTLLTASGGIMVSPEEMVETTKGVIRDTLGNYSSMHQSLQQGKKTEIESINGVFKRIGAERNIDASMNSILVELITALEKQQHP